MGEAKRQAPALQKQAIVLDTFGGRIHMERDPLAAATPPCASASKITSKRPSTTLRTAIHFGMSGPAGHCRNQFSVVQNTLPCR